MSNRASGVSRPKSKPSPEHAAQGRELLKGIAGTWRFDPKPNITAYELAVIYSHLVLTDRPLHLTEIAGLPADMPLKIRRHFRRVL